MSERLGDEIFVI